MRQFLVDQLSREERDNLESYLKRTAKKGPVDGLFWLELPTDLWSGAQQGHEACAPFYFSIELTGDTLIFELLVRSDANLHCSCISYATKTQRDFFLRFIDTMLAEENIRA